MKQATMTAEQYKAWIRSSWTEAEFTREVLALAKQHGWRTAHFRPARTKDGWRTAVQGDGLGFPDLILIRGIVLLAVELKTEKGTVTPAQQAWLDAFAGVDGWVIKKIWRPSDWNNIEGTLKDLGT